LYHLDRFWCARVQPGGTLKRGLRTPPLEFAVVSGTRTLVVSPFRGSVVAVSHSGVAAVAGGQRYSFIRSTSIRKLTRGWAAKSAGSSP
jgi:hypothetical protein